MEKIIKSFLNHAKKYIKVFFFDERSAFPFIIIILMTLLLFYNSGMIVNSQKRAYESDKIANELRNSSEDLTKYVRTFVATGNPKYEKEYWHVLNVRNGKDARSDGRKIPLNTLMKKLGFTRKELKKLQEAQSNSDKLVKKEVIAMNAVNGVQDSKVSRLIRPGESSRDFAIRIMNDEAYHKDKNTIMAPINDVVNMVDQRTQIELIHYNVLNYIYITIAFVIVFLLFTRFILLIDKVKQNVEEEKLVRKIFEAMRSSIEIDSIKNIIVKEVGEALNSDRCCLFIYNKSADAFIVDEYSEYKPLSGQKSLVGIESNNQKILGLINLYRINKEVIFSNFKKFLKENNLEGTSIEKYFREYDIKASYDIPIVNADVMLGILSVQYTKNYKKLTQEDIDFLRILAVQAGEAIYQAELYKEVQLQAEREKISRTIVEILRSSMDKMIIKKLFVKNLGKFFDADRVFFSDYDVGTNTYLQVDENSEYLSNNNQKSFIGFDWTNSDLVEYIQPLLEKREVKIKNFDEYIKENSKINKKLISRYVDFNVKSSYSFPVLHQSDMMGYFCIEFTNRVFELSDEDINRIRSICTQAGIALYHAELYLQAQQCTLSKDGYIVELSKQIKKPASEILDLSTLLTQKEFERQAQVEYLNTIIASCNQLLELTDMPSDEQD